MQDLRLAGKAPAKLKNSSFRELTMTHTFNELCTFANGL